MSARPPAARGLTAASRLALGLGLGLGLALAACAGNSSADAGAADPARAGAANPADRVPQDLRLTLERGPCFGTCPVYSLEIDATGAVRYLGERHVRVPGEVSDSIPAERVAALADQLRNSGFFDLADRYAYGEPNCPEYIADLPSVTLTARMDGRTKQVYADYGCRPIPAAVTDLARAMDEAAGTARWTGVEEM